MRIEVLNTFWCCSILQKALIGLKNIFRVAFWKSKGIYMVGCTVSHEGKWHMFLKYLRGLRAGEIKGLHLGWVYTIPRGGGSGRRGGVSQKIPLYHAKSGDYMPKPRGKLGLISHLTILSPNVSPNQSKKAPGSGDFVNFLTITIACY